MPWVPYWTAIPFLSQEIPSEYERLPLASRLSPVTLHFTSKVDPFTNIPLFCLKKHELV